MAKVTGMTITYGKAKKLRDDAVIFHNTTGIDSAVKLVGGPAEIFYKNLDCAFVFDKDSLLTMLGKILTVKQSGVVMMLGASDDTTHTPSRQHKPTLSIFPCTIDDEKEEFTIIHTNPSNLDITEGEEHPGLVDLSLPSPTVGVTGPFMDLVKGKGTIQFIKESSISG